MAADHPVVETLAVEMEVANDLVIKLHYDLDQIHQGVMTGRYDAKGLQVSESGKYKYPSKLMLIKLLEPILASDDLKDIEGVADLYSSRDLEKGTEQIRLTVDFKFK